MRKFLAGVVLFLVPGCYWQDPAATVRKLEAPGVGWCSAVVIAPDTALTAKHCLGPETLLVDGHKVTAAVPSPDEDIAVLTAPGLACPCAEFGKKPKPGDKVKAIGFPGSLKGEKRTTKETTVKLIGPPSAILPFIPLTETYIYTKESILETGDSGGGLFVQEWDGSWSLVGINSHIIYANPFFPIPLTSGFVPVYEGAQ